MSAEAQRPNDFVTWIGRTRADEYDITAVPVNALAGTLGRPSVDAAAGMPVPPLWHWLFLQRNAPDAVVRSLEFKAVRPSYVGRPLRLRGCPEGDTVRLRASDDEDRLAMTALAELEP